MSKWQKGAKHPKRSGYYERDYTSCEITGIHRDKYRRHPDGSEGFWYVNEPPGQWNDARHQALPWRKVKK